MASTRAEVKKTMHRQTKTISESNKLTAEEEERKLQKYYDHPAHHNKHYKWSLDDFELATRLGRGKFGRVYIARERKTGFIVAVKTLVKSEIAKEGMEHLVLREIEIQTHLKHPNILNLLTWFNDDFRIFLVLEYAAHGEVYDHLKKSPGGYFDERTTAKYLYQVADAINYCHKNHVIHRDIKPENLLLTLDFDIKVSDFGWSVHTPSLRRKTMCGTLDYLPPEMINNEEYSYYVDQWCLGILCYEFLVGKPPFESTTSQETYEKIKKVHIQYPNRVTKGAKSVIQSLLTRDGENRMKLHDLLKHPWIVENMISSNGTS